MKIVLESKYGKVVIEDEMIMDINEYIKHNISVKESLEEGLKVLKEISLLEIKDNHENL